MNVKVRHNILRRIAAVFATAAVAAALGSCEKIYEDLEPCPRGLSLRFIYDYNMEYANAFPKKVDCLTLFVYDAEGNYLDTRTETSAVLRDENYRMTLDLEEGSYRLVAYGGIAREKHSFSLARTPGEGSRIEDLRAAIDADCLTDDRRRNLHGFYWGDLAVRVEGDMYRDATVEMKKNTNNIRVVLQQLNDRPVNDKDFDFSVTDDNTLFGPDNDLIPFAETTYLPWAHGQASTGETDAGDSRNYKMALSLNGMVFDRYFDNLSQLPRNTHVVVTVRIKDTEVIWEADVVPYGEKALFPIFGLDG